jgi:hypothetical protein
MWWLTDKPEHLRRETDAVAGELVADWSRRWRRLVGRRYAIVGREVRRSREVPVAGLR